MEITKNVKSWYGIIATFFTVGCYTKMPGTIGSIAACIIWIAAHGLPWQVIALTFLIGWVAADKYEREVGRTDPGEVVVDEVVGYWLAAFGLPLTFALPALVAFRIIDITKPFPVCTAEKIPGGLGIMMDDVVGGIIVNILLQIFAWLFLGMPFCLFQFCK